MFSNHIRIVTALLALSLIIMGCTGEKQEEESAATSSNPITTIPEVQLGSSSISGKITLDETPTVIGRGSYSLVTSNVVFTVSAYNLTTNTLYQTATNDSGEYTFIGLIEGNYQIVATNETYAKSASRSVLLSRGTNATIDITLQATATIKGTTNAQYVTIPGTSIFASVREQDGGFELTGVPVGEVVLLFSAFDDEGTEKEAYRVFTITAGENNLDLVVDFDKNLLSYISFYAEGGTLAMAMQGVRVVFTDSINKSDLIANLAITGPSGDTLPVERIQVSEYECYEWAENDYIRNSGDSYYAQWSDWNDYAEYYCHSTDDFHAWNVELAIPSSGTFAAGTYSGTVNSFKSIKSGDVIGGTFVENLEAKTVKYQQIMSGTTTNNSLGYIFPGSIKDVSGDLGSISITDASGNALDLSSYNSSLQFEGFGFVISGPFKFNQTYTVSLPSTISVFNGTSFVEIVRDNQMEDVDSADAYKFIFEGPSIGATTPVDGSRNISLASEVKFELEGVDLIDLASLTLDVSTDGVTFIYQAANLTIDYDPMNGGTYISLPGGILEYDKEYCVTARATDTFGNSLTPKTINFRTVNPAIVRTDPGDTYDSFDKLFQEQSFTGFFQAKTNVPVSESASTPLLTLSPGSIESCQWESGNTERRCDPFALQSSTVYEGTWSGFIADDGTTVIADKTFTYITPPRQLVYTEPKSGAVDVNAGTVTVKYLFFGDLTIDEKNALIDNIKVQDSDGTNVSATITVLSPLSVPDSNWSIDFGDVMLVTFNTQSGTYYKVGFLESAIPSSLSSFMPDSVLSFRTSGEPQALPTSTDAVEAFGGTYTFSSRDDCDNETKRFKYNKTVIGTNLTFHEAIYDGIGSWGTETQKTEYHWTGSAWTLASISGTQAHPLVVQYSSPFNGTVTLSSVKDLSGDAFDFGDGVHISALSPGAKSFHSEVSITYPSDYYALFDEINNPATYNSIESFIDTFSWTNYTPGDSTKDYCVYERDSVNICLIIDGSSSVDSGIVYNWDESSPEILSSAGTWQKNPTEAPTGSLVLNDLTVSLGGDPTPLFAVYSGTSTVWRGHFRPSGASESFIFNEYNSVVRDDYLAFLNSQNSEFFVPDSCPEPPAPAQITPDSSYAVWDSFSEVTGFDPSKWTFIKEGNDSSLDVLYDGTAESGSGSDVLELYAINDDLGTTGKGEATVFFPQPDPGMQAFLATVRFTSFSGDPSTDHAAIRLSGSPYATQTRMEGDNTGMIHCHLTMNINNWVGVYCGVSLDASWDNQVTLISETLGEVENAFDWHRLGIGFDGENMVFMLDDTWKVVPLDTFNYPVADAGWSDTTGIRLQLDNDSQTFNATVHVDEVVKGPVNTIFGFSVSETEIDDWASTARYVLHAKPDEEETRLIYWADEILLTSTLTRASYTWDATSGEFSSTPDSAYRNQSYFLDSGSWVPWNPTDVSYDYDSESATYISPFNMNIRVINSMDLGGQSWNIKTSESEIPLTNLSTGAKASAFVWRGYNTSDLYTLQHVYEKDGYIPDALYNVNGSLDLVDADGNEVCSCVYIDRSSFGDSGPLVNYDKCNYQFGENIGEWSNISIEGTEILVIDLSADLLPNSEWGFRNNVKNPIFAVYNSEVWFGELYKAGTFHSNVAMAYNSVVEGDLETFLANPANDSYFNPAGGNSRHEITIDGAPAQFTMQKDPLYNWGQVPFNTTSGSSTGWVQIDVRLLDPSKEYDISVCLDQECMESFGKYIQLENTSFIVNTGTEGFDFTISESPSFSSEAVFEVQVVETEAPPTSTNMIVVPSEGEFDDSFYPTEPQYFKIIAPVDGSYDLFAYNSSGFNTLSLYSDPTGLFITPDGDASLDSFGWSVELTLTGMISGDEYYIKVVPTGTTPGGSGVIGYLLQKSVSVSDNSYQASSLSSLDTWFIGGETSASWDNAISGENVRLYIGSPTADLSADSVNARTWKLVQGPISNIQTATFPVPIGYGHGLPGRLLIVDNLGNWDVTDTDLTFSDPPVDDLNYVSTGLTSPNGGELFNIGDFVTVSWDSTRLTGTGVKTYYISDTSGIGTLDAATINSLEWIWANYYSNVGSASWYTGMIDPSTSGNIRLLVISEDGQWDISDADFQLLNP